MVINPAKLEILRSYFNSIVSSMGHVIERTSFSTYVRESADFATALATTEGEFFAYPTSVGVTIFLGLNLQKAIETAGPFNEGDIVITNDPYSTDGLATHLPDVNLFKPIFYNHEIVSYAWTFVHVSDVGGSVPSSISPHLTSMFQEGLRIPPVKLYQEGKKNREVFRLLTANSRTPVLNAGDIDAMVSAVNTAEGKIRELIAKFGEGTIKQGMDDLLRQSEDRTRKIIHDIKDGTYTFSDYIDDDMESNVPIRLSIDTTIHQDEITFDFSDCDPQVKTAFNLMTNGKKNSFLLQGFINFVISKDPFIPINGGIMRPVHVVMPKGTLVNPSFPAPVGIRHSIAMRMYNVILGSLMKAKITAIPAAGAGQAAIVVLHNETEMSKKNKMAVVEPIGGGGGATSISDGLDGIDHASGFLKNTPIESLEQNIDVLVHQYQLINDTAGAGEKRGGSAIALDFETLQPAASVTARGMERLKFQPWGVEGGHAGITGKVIKLTKEGDTKTIAKISVLNLQKGDILSIQSPSGGGWGSPYQRKAEFVLNDVENDYIHIKTAEKDYGVMIKQTGDTFMIDWDATKRCRKNREYRQRGKLDFGVYRTNYETKWPSETSNYLANFLRKNVAVNLIPEYKHQIHEYFHKYEIVMPADIDKFFAAQKLPLKK